MESRIDSTKEQVCQLENKMKAEERNMSDVTSHVQKVEDKTYKWMLRNLMVKSKV